MKFLNKIFYSFIFIKHNRKQFRHKLKVKKKTQRRVLVEINNLAGSIIGYSLIANIIGRDSDAELVAFRPGFVSLRARTILLWGLSGQIYRSFGVTEFVFPRPSKTLRSEALYIGEKALKSIQTKRDLERYSLFGISIGDLIYDSFLKNYTVTSVDLNSKDFKIFFLESVEIFLFWLKYFQENKISAVLVSHTVYLNAIPARVGLMFDAVSLQINASHLYRLRAEKPFAYSDFVEYKTIFDSLPHDVREAGVKKAAARIQKRFSGDVGVDMRYSQKSAFSPTAGSSVLVKSDKLKILIAAHCFFDSPHSYGLNIFPDFFEWLDFLAEMSNQTDYDWYIKTHPDYKEKTREWLVDFCEKHSKFSLLPADVSHFQIIDEEIDVALTVYGTIGFEYAALGIPVINASNNNPHCAFDFNINPSNVDEYRIVLLDLDEVIRNFEPDFENVCEFYFMHKIYYGESWLFDDLDDVISYVGSWKEIYSPKMFRYWVINWERHLGADFEARLLEYLRSGSFRFKCLSRNEMLSEGGYSEASGGR